MSTIIFFVSPHFFVSTTCFWNMIIFSWWAPYLFQLYPITTQWNPLLELSAPPPSPFTSPRSTRVSPLTTLVKSQAKFSNEFKRKSWRVLARKTIKEVEGMVLTKKGVANFFVKKIHGKLIIIYALEKYSAHLEFPITYIF